MDAVVSGESLVAGLPGHADPGVVAGLCRIDRELDRRAPERIELAVRLIGYSPPEVLIFLRGDALLAFGALVLRKVQSVLDPVVVRVVDPCASQGSGRTVGGGEVLVLPRSRIDLIAAEIGVVLEQGELGHLAGYTRDLRQVAPAVDDIEPGGDLDALLLRGVLGRDVELHRGECGAPVSDLVRATDLHLDRGVSVPVEFRGAGCVSTDGGQHIIRIDAFGQRRRIQGVLHELFPEFRRVLAVDPETVVVPGVRDPVDRGLGVDHTVGHPVDDDVGQIYARRRHSEVETLDPQDVQGLVRVQIDGIGGHRCSGVALLDIGLDGADQSVFALQRIHGTVVVRAHVHGHLHLHRLRLATIEGDVNVTRAFTRLDRDPVLPGGRHDPGRHVVRLYPASGGRVDPPQVDLVGRRPRGGGLAQRQGVLGVVPCTDVAVGGGLIGLILRETVNLVNGARSTDLLATPGGRLGQCHGQRRVVSAGNDNCARSR